MPWHEMKFWPARGAASQSPPARQGRHRPGRCPVAGRGRPGRGRAAPPPPASGARANPAPARARPCARRPPWSGDRKYPLRPLCAFLRHTQTFLNVPPTPDVHRAEQARSRVRDECDTTPWSPEWSPFSSSVMVRACGFRTDAVYAVTRYASRARASSPRPRPHQSACKSQVPMRAFIHALTMRTPLVPHAGFRMPLTCSLVGIFCPLGQLLPAFFRLRAPNGL